MSEVDTFAQHRIRFAGGMSSAILQRKQTVSSESARPGERRLLVGLFVVYLALLTWAIVWKLETPFIGENGLRHIKLVPVVASGPDGASDPLEVAANILLFLPFGMYLSLLIPSWPLWKHTGTIAAASLILEAGQYVLRAGSTDVTDVMSNTVGGIAGVVTVVILQRADRLRTAVATRICLVGTALALLACVGFFVSPLDYVLQDVPLDPS
ncbi:VanZ family protein [Microbacterium sp.]|uniref:VanZ family protein n=1 Tax=Microbacterium sp. TaxID=51671 RepID=UPI0039E5E589